MYLSYSLFGIPNDIFNSDEEFHNYKKYDFNIAH